MPFASIGEAGVNAFPFISIFPDVGTSSPIISFSNVDLPAPFSPTKPITLPAGISISTLLSASVPGYCFVTFDALNNVFSIMSLTTL